MRRPAPSIGLSTSTVQTAARTVEVWLKGKDVQHTADIRILCGLSERLAGEAIRHLEETGRIKRIRRYAVCLTEHRPSTMEAV